MMKNGDRGFGVKHERIGWLLCVLVVLMGQAGEVLGQDRLSVDQVERVDERFDYLPVNIRQGMGVVKVGQIMVYYQNVFADKQAEIEAWAEQMNRIDQQAQAELRVMSESMAKIGAKVDELVGGMNAEQIVKSEGGQFLGRMASRGGLMGVVRGDVVVALVDRKDVFEFLSIGGKVPGLSYDPKTGEGALSLEVKSRVGEERPQIELVMPVEKDGVERNGRPADLKATLTGLKQVLSGAKEDEETVLRGVAIHELAEVSILKRLKKQSAHSRWFSDGMAETVTWLTLKDLYGEAAAKSYERDVEGYEGMVKDLDLLRWEAKAVEPETGLPAQMELTNARYAYAAIEMKRIVDEHGQGVIKQLIDSAVQRGGGQATDESLVAAVSAVDPGFGQRMKRYEKYEGGRQAMAMGYVNELREAMQKQAYDDAIMAFLHVKEQRTNLQIDDYYRLANMVAQNGDVVRGEQILLKLENVLKQPDAKAQVNKALVRYYMSHKMFEKAGEIAPLVLKVEPDDEAALQATLIRQMRQDKFGQAEVTAKRLKMVARPEDGTGAYETADSALKWIEENVGVVGVR